VDDLTQYGVTDLWVTPLTLFTSNAGDCEDYAIAKYVALREIGIADEDVRLVIVHDNPNNQDHAVTAVRYEGQWRILDNLTLDIRRDVELTAFDPLFLLDSEGAKRITASAPRPPNSFETTRFVTAMLQIDGLAAFPTWQIQRTFVR
jgi:hypothetical protein